MNEQGKVWFISGASSGFGRALVEEAVGRGDRVVATARDPRSLDWLSALPPARVHAARLDVTKPDQVRASVDAALEHFGAIDVLVNNAGYSLLGAVEETSDDEIRAAFETMFFGAIALTRAVLPHLRERRAGTVVQISSVGGLVTMPGFGPYCAVKHALEALSESFAGEVAPFGIRVLIVEPGAFRTRLFGPAFRVMPALEAYAPTVGPARAYAAEQNGAQGGDPAKAAKAIADAVAAGSPTLRLPLGADAVKGIRDKLAHVAGEVDRTERVANDTAF